MFSLCSKLRASALSQCRRAAVLSSRSNYRLFSTTTETGIDTSSALFRQAAYIDGKWVTAAASTIPVHNPACNTLLGTVPNLQADHTQQAIEAAEEAFELWKNTPAKVRGAAVRKWGDLMLENNTELAALMTAEQGKPLAEAVGEIGYAASFLHYYANLAEHNFGQTLPAYAATSRVTTIRQPVGVVGVVTPWNFPSAMITRKAGPALAAGCTMVIKPSELTPYSALALCELAEQAGIPKGVLNVVTGDAPAIGETLMASAAVRKISFTGSTAVGKLLTAQAAQTMKRVSMELGGNAPFIVFADANLDNAVAGVLASKFKNAGQTCVSANRIFVHADVYEIFTEKLTIAIQKLKTGAGVEKDVNIGPLINAAAVEKVAVHIADAVEQGGQIVTGPQSVTEGELFVAPTLVVNATPEMLCFSQESFGPLAPLFKFNSEQEVLKLANAVPVGLAAYFYTESISRVHRVTEQLQFGMVAANQATVSDASAPFGGIKESGLGREGGTLGIDEYLQYKTCHVGINPEADGN